MFSQIFLNKCAVTVSVVIPVFQIPSQGNTLCLKMIHDFLGILEHPTPDLVEFQSWFNTKLIKVLDDTIHTTGLTVKVDREKMWSLFHQMRSETPFQSRWIQFLEKHSMPQEPLFYQHVTTKAFTALLKLQCELEIESPFEKTAPITNLNHEEENAVRYIGGYILRSLRTKAKKEKLPSYKKRLTILTEMSLRSQKNGLGVWTEVD